MIITWKRHFPYFSTSCRIRHVNGFCTIYNLPTSSLLCFVLPFSTRRRLCRASFYLWMFAWHQMIGWQTQLRGASIVQQNAQSWLLANSSIYVSLDIVLWVLSSNVTSSKPIEFGKGYITYIGAAVGGSVRFSNFQAVEWRMCPTT